jgi:cell division transport system permease protein
MLDWLFAAPADRKLLPGGRLRGATPYVIAIMTFAMMVVAAAGLALSNAAGVVASGIEDRYAVQLPGQALEQGLKRLAATPGVRNVEPVPESEMRRTLERWLGPAGAQQDLPVPALINFDLAAGTDVGSVRSRIEAAVPGARVTAHEQSLRPLLGSIRTLQWLALTLVMLMAGAAAAAVVLAARGALDTHRSTIEVMHGIGSTDVQVTRLFQRKIALDALAGSVAGGAAAALVLALIAGGGAALASDLAGAPPLRLRDLLILAALPFVLVVLATWVARTAVLAALRQST